MITMIRRGFTVVEYVVVVSIVAMLSMVFYPNFGRLIREANARQAAEQVADFYRGALEKSLGQQRIFGVLMNASTGQLQMLDYGDSFNPSLTGTVVETMVLDNKVELTDISIIDAATGTNLVRYTASGAPSTTGAVTVQSTSGAAAYVVTVTPSGQTKVNSQDAS